MADDKEEVEKKARALLDDEKAEPDALIDSMRAVLSTKRPWWYSFGHTLEQALPGTLFDDKFDDWEKQIVQYAKFWGEVKNGSRKIKDGPDGKPKIVKLGQKILRGLLNDEPITAGSFIEGKATFAKDTVYEAGTAAKEAVTSTVNTIRDAVTPSTGTIAGIVLVGLLAVAVATRKSRI